MKLEFESYAKVCEWVKAILDNAFQENDVKKDIESNETPLFEKYPISIDAQVEDIKKRVLDYIKIIKENLK